MYGEYQGNDYLGRDLYQNLDATVQAMKPDKTQVKV